jgi:triosephosphate isomerase
MSRRPLIAGNWKMNLTQRAAVDLVHRLAAALPAEVYEGLDVAVLPAFAHIRTVGDVIAGENLRLAYGAQDLSAHDSGAYTGDVSGPMLTDLGCRYVVVGHSERREHHGEDDALVHAKVQAALRNHLTPILCVGEGLDVRSTGGHIAYSVGQLDADLASVSTDQVVDVVIAYEPVWAIGTGRVATPGDAQEVCGALRRRLADRYGGPTAEGLLILYGGSVKSGNVGELAAQPDIDGALVGGASLDADDFAKLCGIAAGVAVG